MGGVETTWQVGLLSPFYQNSAPVNKKIQGVLGGNFVGADVLFTVPFVVRKSGVTDSRLPKLLGRLTPAGI
jgi:hypothetical protein